MSRLDDLPIKRKLTLMMLLTSTVILVLASAAFAAYELITFRSSMVLDATVLADVLAGNSIATMKFDQPEEAEKTLSTLRAEPHVEAACLYKEGGGRFAEYLRGSGEAAAFPEKPGADGGQFAPGHLALFRPVVDLDGKPVGTIYLRVDLEGMHERIRLYAGITGLVLLSSILLTLALVARLQRVISHPILALAETARGISERKDYSVRATRQGADETGRLTDAFNQMLTEIEAGQRALEEAHRSLLAQAGQIRESVGVLGSAAGRILDFSTQVARSAAENATAVTETTTTVEEVRQTAQNSATRARSVAESALKAAETSQGGKKSAEEAAEGMRRIREQMESIAERMGRLSEQSQAIRQIVATVEDLAAQSNLLAVNAAIEAAKAGEQGRGFAVVAQEVKNLAGQSRQATAQVRSILNDIQKATGEAVWATEQGTRAVEAGVRQSTQAGESILTLANNVAEASEAATQIAASSQQQSVGMDQVAAAMTSVKQSSLQNVDSARQLETAARDLNELGHRLQTLAEGYRA